MKMFFLLALTIFMFLAPSTVQAQTVNKEKVFMVEGKNKVIIEDIVLDKFFGKAVARVQIRNSNGAVIAISPSDDFAFAICSRIDNCFVYLYGQTDIFATVLRVTPEKLDNFSMMPDLPIVPIGNMAQDKFSAMQSDLQNYTNDDTVIRAKGRVFARSEGAQSSGVFIATQDTYRIFSPALILLNHFSLFLFVFVSVMIPAWAAPVFYRFQQTQKTSLKMLIVVVRTIAEIGYALFLIFIVLMTFSEAPILYMTVVWITALVSATQYANTRIARIAGKKAEKETHDVAPPL